MSAKIVVGLDRGGTAGRALAHASKLAALIGDCELILVHVIEWSAFSFQTPDENAERHKRHDEEIAAARSELVDPAVAGLKAEGFAARGVVRHGQISEVIDAVAVEEGADQIVVGRASDEGLAERLFGTSTEKLVGTASVPVTVVG